MTEGARLLDGAFSASDDVLLFDRFDPEPWWVISQICNQGDKRATLVNGIPAFGNLAIEVWDYRDKQIGRVFAPELFEKAHRGTVEEPDCKLKNAQEIFAAEGPSILQHEVVLLLDANAGQLAKDVRAVGQILELHEFHLPRPSLLGRDGLEGDGGVAMAAATVMEDNVNFFMVDILPYA